MAIKTWATGEQLAAADLNNNFAEVNKAMTAYFMQPVYPLSNIAGVALSSNTMGYTGMFVIPTPITVNSIHVYVSGYTSNGTLKLGIYSEDGQTKLIEVTTSTITAIGLKTTAVSSVLLPRGTYYIVAVSSGASLFDIRFASSAADTVFNNPTGKKIASGTITVTAGTLPTTFTPTSITPTQNAPFFRLDN